MSAVIPADVQDNADLLSAMMADAESADRLWVATAYWRNYADRIRRELKRNGLRNFRVNQRILKGFGVGGVRLPSEPAAAWKRTIFRWVSDAPVVSRVIREYRRVASTQHKAATEIEVRYAKMVLAEIADAFPNLTPPKGIANGGADDAFDWRGYVVTAEWVKYLARLVDFYRAVDPMTVRRILEIGPGLGLSSLAHVALNPHLTFIVNVDIPPVAYVSSCFMASIPDVESVDYLASRNLERIPVGNDGRPVRILQLLPWLLPKLVGQVDYSFNAFSFQEMERDICRNYAEQILRLTDKGVLLRSTVEGHKAGAGGQRAPVSMKFLTSLFESKFPNRQTLDGIWTDRYDGDPRTIALLQK